MYIVAILDHLNLFASHMTEARSGRVGGNIQRGERKIDENPPIVVVMSALASVTVAPSPPLTEPFAKSKVSYQGNAIPFELEAKIHPILGPASP